MSSAIAITPLMDHGSLPRFRASHFCLFLLLATFASAVRAQSGASGQVNGTITDAAGGVVAQAPAVLRNTGTGVEQRASSNESGQYRFLNVSPGTYTLSVSVPGFKSVNLEPFHLDVNQNLTHDMRLEVGEINQKVDVKAQAELVQRASTELGTVVERKAILDLPLNSRNFTQLITLTPGASVAPNGGTSVNGQWTSNNAYGLDGSNNTSVINVGVAIVPILDTLDEFKVQSHNDQAEFGGFLGAQINVATRAGTNEVHGNAWEFLRNSAFNARNPFTNATTPITPFRQNRYGVTFGGPVVIPKLYNGHNKTFFFFGFEGYKNRTQSQALERVPTNQELSGDFSAPGLPMIYDPATGAPFPGNRIDPSRISSTTLGYIRTVFERPNYTGNSFYNSLQIFPNPTNTNQYSIRVDQTLGEKDSIWGRYTQFDGNTTSSQSSTVFLPSTTSSKNVGAGWNHSFSPSLFLESRFTWNQLFVNFSNQITTGTGPLLQAGFSANQITAYGLPDLQLQSPWNSPGVSGVGINNQSNPFALSEGLTWLAGKHQVKAGYEIVQQEFQNVGRGQHYFFTNQQTANPAELGTTGASLASALLGLPNSISDTQGIYTEKLNIWGAYIQDSWKVSPKLTVNIGVRYDQYPTLNFTQGSISLFDMSSGDWLIGASKLPPSCNSAGVAPCIPGNGLQDVPYGNKIRLADRPGILDPIHDNIGPRAGIAYSFNDKTVIRVGYGIYYDTTGATAQEAQNPSNNWPSANGINQTYNQPGQPVTTFSQLAGQTPSLLPVSSPWTTNGYQWYPNRKNGRSQQYHVDLQRQLQQNLLLSVAYVGNVSNRLDMTVVNNIALTPGPGTRAQVNARQPYPYMTPLTYGTDWGTGNYNSLQVKLEKRASNGLSGILAYTFSKALDNGSSAFFATSVQDTYHPSTSYGPSDYDRTHVLVMSGTWELPFGAGKRWLRSGVAKYLLGNWQLSAINTIESGNPLNLHAQGDVANVGNTFFNYARPNLTGNPYALGQTEKAWFNPSAFAVPNFSYGNFGRNALRGPAFFNSDISLLKNIPIRERLSTQLRFESFNSFNLMNLGNPATTLGSGNLGQISSIQGSPRNLQFAVKLLF